MLGPQQSSTGNSCPTCGSHFQGAPDCQAAKLKCPRCGTNLSSSSAEQPSLEGRLNISWTDDPSWDAPRRERPHPPQRAMVSGVFSFPCYLSTLPRWGALAAWLAILLVLLRTDIGFLADAGIIARWGAVCCSLFTALIFGIWFAVTCATLLAVLEDTAAGLDRVENWPESIWLEGFWAPVLIFNSSALAALPGIGISWTLWHVAAVAPIAVPASLIVLFPIVLLSMLEAGSAIVPVSRALWSSLANSWRVWMEFYLESGLLAVSAGWCAWALWSGQALGCLALAAMTVTGALLIYFRLLGRLTWLCTQQSLEENDDVPNATGDSHASVTASRLASPIGK